MKTAESVFHNLVFFFFLIAYFQERRRKNNLAAKRSRDARRIKEDEIAIRAAFLGKRYNNIWRKFNKLEGAKFVSHYRQGVKNKFITIFFRRIFKIYYQMFFSGLSTFEV